jgi:hypothetical protein
MRFQPGIDDGIRCTFAQHFADGREKISPPRSGSAPVLSAGSMFLRDELNGPPSTSRLSMFGA